MKVDYKQLEEDAVRYACTRTGEDGKARVVYTTGRSVYVRLEGEPAPADAAQLVVVRAEQ